VTVLGIETSCDECAAAVVADGAAMLSNVVYSQIEEHRRYQGVVPEIASRKHVEWIDGVVEHALADAEVDLDAIDAVAVTSRPGLIGSLLVGLSYAKGLALARGLPMIAVDHVQAHFYAPHMESDLSYPYIGLLLSGGHSLIAQVHGFDRIEVMGATIDDACGEAFDKVAKYFDIGFPGGVAIQNLAEGGDAAAFRFPRPSLHKGDHRFDVSYSGLKTAVIHQRAQFRDPAYEDSLANLAAAFQQTAVDIVVDKALLASQETGIDCIVAAGGVAANTYLRRRLDAEPVRTVYPSLKLCTDNAAMIAGLGYHLLARGERSGLDTGARARVGEFRARYP
jgi:N6-L-threonylcarbamoyladenine synthase